ncbi:MAG: hypothetical protein JO142_17420 [Burkholderiales bacterium]|nr:hypothetical protein [Burkholderiales bacterium]
MTYSKMSKSRSEREPDSEVELSRLMKEAPTPLAQHIEQSVRRGTIRRRVEDYLLEKAAEDLW